MNGISGADGACYRQAKYSQFRGTYRAFLSSKVQDMRTLIFFKKDRSIPIVNLMVSSDYDLNVFSIHNYIVIKYQGERKSFKYIALSLIQKAVL